MTFPHGVKTRDLRSAPPAVRRTVAEAAAEAGVSPRLVGMAREVQRSGRAELIEAMQSGALTVHAAWRTLRGPQQGEGARLLRRGWAKATMAERAEFLAEVRLAPEGAKIGAAWHGRAT